MGSDVLQEKKRNCPEKAIYKNTESNIFMIGRLKKKCCKEIKHSKP